MNADRDFLDELIQESFAEEMMPSEGFRENLLRQIRIADGGRKSWIPVICAAASVLLLFIGGMFFWQGRLWDGGAGKENYQEACLPTGKEEPLQESGKSGDGSHISDKRRGDNDGVEEDDAGTARLTAQAEGDGQNGEQSLKPPVSASQGTSRPDTGNGGTKAYYEVIGVEDDAPTTPAVSQTEAPAEVKLPGGIVIPGGGDSQDVSIIRTSVPCTDMTSAVPRETVLPTSVPSSASAPPEGIFCKVTSFVWAESASSPTEYPVISMMPEATPGASQPEATPGMSKPEFVPGTVEDLFVWNSSGTAGIKAIDSDAGFKNLKQNLIASGGEIQGDNVMCEEEGKRGQYDEQFFKTHTLCVVMTEEIEGSRFDSVWAEEKDGFLYITLQCHRGEEKDEATKKVMYLCVVEIERRPSEDYVGSQIKIIY